MANLKILSLFLWMAGCLTSLSVAENPLSSMTPAAVAKPAPPGTALALSNALDQVTRELDKAGTNAAFRTRGEKLRQIKRLIEERIDVVKDPDTVTATLATEMPEVPSLTETEAPFPLGTVDALRQARSAAERAILTLQTLYDSAQHEFDTTQDKQQALEREYRLLAENKDTVADRQARLGTLKLDIRVAEQQTGLAQARLPIIRSAKELLEANLQSIEEQLRVVGRAVVFSHADFEQQRFRIDRREALVKNLLLEAQLELQQQTGRDTKSSVADMRTLRREVDILEARLQLVDEARTVWQRRFTLYKDKKHAAEFETWCNEARAHLDRLNRTIRLKRAQYDEAKAAIRDASEEADTGDASYTRLAAALDGYLAGLQQNIEINQHLLDDYELLYRKNFLGPAVWDRISRAAVSIWNHELTAIDERPITVKKVVYAILLILVGLKLARLFSHVLVQRILGKFKVEESSTASISTLLFYFFSLMVTVIALGVANIPLTLFTLLGGALAIGVGFGSQNILNNFISGLILLIERPIRKGDMVEVGVTHGRVERVGLRCTQVRTFANVDILVPNSTFLETNVVNMTLSDDRYKAELFVGVVYGAPTQRVRELMLKAAQEHEKVLPSPAPEVMFMDFGDNSLVFRLYAWVRMRQPSDRDRVLSDLRFHIDEMFRAEDLVIAFPQRDIHLDTTSPLEIRMVPSDQRAGTNGDQ